MHAIANDVNKTGKEISNAEIGSRQGLYRLFGRFLSKEIDQQLLDDLREPGFAAAVNELGICLDAPTNDDDLFLEQLAIEFTRLFLGPGKHISPHESVQIGRDGILNDATTVRVSHFIEVAGYQFKADSKKYPDHICSEFEFMEALISKQIEAIADGDLEEAETSKMLQDEFLQRHLVLWIPQFCEEIEQSAKRPLYKAIGRAISAFIKMENEQSLQP
jgi:TorA maturation chaperone TorD